MSFAPYNESEDVTGLTRDIAAKRSALLQFFLFFCPLLLLFRGAKLSTRPTRGSPSCNRLPPPPVRDNNITTTTTTYL